MIRQFAALSLAALLGSTALSACGSRQSVDPENYAEAAEYAFERAQRSVQRRDYEGARGLFTEVYENFPYSEYAVLAEFRIADCFYLERSWARAIEAYRRFVRFHPSHPAVPEAELQIALSYVRQMPGDLFLMPPSHERELRDARAAYDQLTVFLARWGTSDFAETARNELATVRDRLAAHELYVARFYLRRGNPFAAATRADTLINRYAESSLLPAGLFIYARAMLELNDVDAAAVALRRLAADYAATDEGRDAAAYLSEWGI